MPDSNFPRSRFCEGDAARTRLAELGFGRDEDGFGRRGLLTGLDHGDAMARSTNPLHPAAYIGQRMWGESWMALRSIFRVIDWEPEVFLNVDMMVNRRYGTAVILTKGDVQTGTSGIPRAAYERGEVTSHLLNRGVLDNLFGAAAGFARPNWLAWLLLHHRTPEGYTAELSLPDGCYKGQITGWRERIVLQSPEDRDGIAIPVAPEEAPPIDFDLPRRSA